MEYQRTRNGSGVAICPYFTWTSEGIGEPPGYHSETDVNLTYCSHPDNPDQHEGNCCVRDCPITKKGSHHAKRQ